MFSIYSNGSVLRSRGSISWAPTSIDHEPNPPIIIEDYPFSQKDWPDPLFGKRPSLITLHGGYLSSADANEAFKPIDWRNPDPVKRQNLGFASSILPNLTPPEQAPFKFVELTNPFLKTRGTPGIEIWRALGIEDEYPVGKTISFVPDQKKIGHGYTYSRQQFPPEEPPFVPIEFRNPDLLKQQNLGFINPRPQYFTEPEAPPSTKADWPVYQRKPYVLITINPKIGDEGPDDPVGQTHISVDLRSKAPALSWIQSRPQYYTDIKPFKQDEWPNPNLFARKYGSGYVTFRQLESVVQNPFSPILFDNPRLKKQPTLSWIFLAPFQQIFTQPLGSQIDVIPASKKRNLAGWLQPRPFYYTEPGGNPISPFVWPVPGRLHNGLIVDISTRFTVSPTGVPFKQTDWPNPRKKRYNTFWIDYFTIDDNLPAVIQSYVIPRIKSQFVPTFIQSRVLSEQNPAQQLDYPNPIRIRHRIRTHIDNLLQSTLDPGVGGKPFNQNDYPNPIIGARNFHSGWIINKPTYYTEEPLQPAQYDWPLFVPIRRNDVGFIKFIIPSEDNRFTSVAEVPVRKLRMADTWVDSIIIPAGIVPGLKPFAQTEWPNPRIRRKIDIYTINGQDYIILPQVHGRVICLIANIDEFDLLATVDEFDLPARQDEFDFEAGGNDCE